MNLCKKIQGIGLPIYKVLLHKEHAIVHHIFVGSVDSKVRDVLIKIERQGVGKLTKENRVLLENEFGENYQKSLGLDLEDAHLRYVYNRIHRDDTLYALRCKLSNEFNANPRDVYTWISSPLEKNTESYWDSMLTPLFKEKPFITGDLLKTLLFNLCGKNNLELEDDKTLDKHEAIIHLKQANPRTVNIPLGFKYVLDSQYVFFPVVPDVEASENIAKKDVQSWKPIWELQQHIETYVTSANIIHAYVKETTTKHETVHNSIYFPELPKRYESCDELLENNEKEFKSLLNCYTGKSGEGAHELNDCMVNFIHFRNEALLEANIPLNKIFNTFVPENEVTPIVKYVNRDSSIIKFNKSVIKMYEKQDILSWAKQDPYKRHMGSESIVMKVVTASGKHATLVLYATGTCDLEIKYGVDGVSIGTIKKDIASVNDVLKNLHEGIPLLNTSVFTLKPIETTTKIIRMILASTLVSPTKVLTDDELQLAFSEFGTIFSTLPKSKGVVRLIYKKVSGFANDDHISQYISRNNPNDKQRQTTLVNNLVSIFGIDPKSAKSYVSNWASIYQQYMMKLGLGVNMYNANSKYMQFTTVKIKPSVLGYKIMIDGLSNPIYYKRILQYITCILEQKPKGIKPSVNNPKPQNNIVFEDEIFNNLNNEDDLEDNEEYANLYNNIMEQIKKNQDSQELDEEDEIADDDEEAAIEDEKAQKGKKGKKKGEDLTDANHPYNKYILEELYKADPTLFKFKTDPASEEDTYPQKCQRSVMRQPIVLEKHELDSMKPESYSEGYVNYGSSPELANKNYYICPEVWCPKSRKAMTMKEYTKNKKKCPVPDIDEKAIILDKYWEKGQKHYIGYLQASVHPQRLRLPCCFKTNQLGKDADVASKGNERYIKAFGQPVQPKRYGLLPAPLGTLLGNKKCGVRPDGTGAMNTQTDCFLRSGIELRAQSFLYLMTQILNNDALKTENDVVNAILNNLTIEMFMSLYGGQLIRRYIENVDRNAIHDPVTFAKFRNWFVNSPGYVKKFKLKYLHEDMKHVVYDKERMKYPKEYMREFLIYMAYHKFMNYIKDDTLIKSHEFLLELFNHHFDWLNTRGHNIVLFERDGKNVYIPCNTNMIPRLAKPCLFIIKNGQYYEPIHHVTINKQSNKIEAHTKFTEDEYYDLIRKLMRVLNSGCSRMDVIASHSSNVLNALKLAEVGKVYQVVSFDFKLIGFWLKQAATYIPLRVPSSILYDSNENIMYINQVFEKGFNIKRTDAMKILQAMNLHLSDDEKYIVKYKTINYLEIDPLKFGASAYVPLNNDIDESLLNFYDIDLDLLTKWEDQDERIDYTNTSLVLDRSFKSLWNEIMKVVARNKDVRDTIAFCRHPSNPIPMSVKQDLILEKLKDAFVKTVRDKTKSQGLHSIVAVVLQAEKNPSKFINKVCSSIGKISECVGQCKWFRNYNHTNDKYDGNKKLTVIGGKCMLGVSRETYSIVLSRVLYNLLNKSIPLSKQIVNDDTVKTNFNNIVVLSEIDIKNGKLNLLYNQRQNKDEWGLETRDVFVEDDVVWKKEQKSNPVLSSIVTGEKFESVGTTLKKEFKGFEVIDNENYDKMWIYKLFSLLHNRLHQGKTYSVQEIKDYTIGKMLKDYESKKPTLLTKLALNPHLTKHLKNESGATKASPSLEEFESLIASDGYYPSDAELVILSQLVKINVVVMGRKTTRRPDNVWCIGMHEKPLSTILLRHKHKQQGYDQYDLILKNKSQFMFDDDDFDKATWEKWIVEKCRVHVVKKPSAAGETKPKKSAKKVVVVVDELEDEDEQPKVVKKRATSANKKK